MTSLADALRPSRLIDPACLRACWRLGRQPARFGGADSAFTYLGAMALVIGLSWVAARVPVVATELAILVFVACLLPAVIRRSRALGAPLALLGIGTALLLGTGAMASGVPFGGSLPNLPLAWHAAAVAVSRETQAGLLVLALAPARRQVGWRRRLRIGLTLAVAAGALAWAMLAL